MEYKVKKDKKVGERQYYEVSWMETVEHKMVVKDGDLDNAKLVKQQEIDALNATIQRKTLELQEFDKMKLKIETLKKQ